MNRTQQIAELIASARPGSHILYIEIPSDSDPVAEEPVAAPTQACDSTEPTTDLAAAGTIAPTRALKVTEWADLLPTASGREIERAIASGVLAARRKGDGRDWAAAVVTAQDMSDYLATCEAVQTGARPIPTWWSDVRKGTAATIHRTERAA